ncbi:hypothetical protein [Microbacterium rhizomatis]|uniref:LPXTG cell wall anchor domain-containing protein n=1 Tax=Microbacterium rhizomatis TaxID=1631477 RepID=A0A5J5IZS7_9MICO|nr:hypothetical protein [Microbacterium rhizomatis]KAA9107786.1 hypothetical protein F6B43_10125 [Microbacterium rhizomatis]
MFKKTAAVLFVAGALLLSGAAAANASTYPVGAGGFVSDTTPAPGQPITLTANIPADSPQDFAVFTLTGDPGGATLASIVRAAAPAGLQKPVVNGTSSAVFTANNEGTFTVAAFDSNGRQVASFELVVSAANADGGLGSTDGGSALPATGGAVPLTAIWIGVGAVGMGSIAVVAAVARRRAQSNH